MRVKHAVILSVTLVAFAVLLWGAKFFWDNLRGAWPAVRPDSGELLIAANTTGLPLSVPAGFSLSLFAKDIPGARVIAQDSRGNYWVSKTANGEVMELVVEDGNVARARQVFYGLNRPHGIAFDPDDPSIIYIAEETRISRGKAVLNSPLSKIADLPSSGGGHYTRTIGFGPDGRLYVSVGSSCNVCNEDDARRAAILSMKKDGSDLRQVARGLRNAVFFAWDNNGALWATEMGRDLLGDDIPPDEVNVITSGANYGWPICYGNNIHDENFDKNTYIRNPCMEPFETPARIEIPAHSAPLGIAFVPDSWPERYRGGIIVAYHGSWNRSVPAGYKIVVFLPDAYDRYKVEQLVSGWLTPENRVLGRPVGLLVDPDGSMLITDDKAGVIYKLFPP